MFGHWEIALVGLVVVLLFGPKQLPRLGKGIGETFREIRGIGKEINKGLLEEDDDAES